MADQNNQNAGASKLHPRAGEFDIPKFVLKKYADLVVLILDTKSMDDKERQYWFHILPIMSQQQVAKLRNILDNEKQKLAQIDKEYTNKLNDVQNKQINHWESEDYKEKMAEVREREKTAEEEEKAAEAKLLEELENI